MAEEWGFDIRCEKAYFETLKHTLETSRDGEITFQYKPPRILKRNYGDEFTIFIAEAPTQSLLQKWLREKHNIHLIAYKNINIDGYDWCFITTDGITNINSYKTYEDAYEIGLREALKLI